MSDEDAIMLFNWLRFGTIFGLCTVGLVRWLAELGLDGEALTTLKVVMVLIFLVFWYFIILKARTPVAKLMIGSDRVSNLPFFIRMFAQSWHHLTGLYLVFAGLVSVYRLIMGLPDALGLMAALFFTLVSCLTVYGIGTVIIDRLLSKRQIQFQQANDSREDRDRPRSSRYTGSDLCRYSAPGASSSYFWVCRCLPSGAMGHRSF